MSYHETIRDLAYNPEELELAYHQAVKAGDEAAFAEAVEAGYAKPAITCSGRLALPPGLRLAARLRAGSWPGAGAARGRAQRPAALAVRMTSASRSR